jgi:hypothetical protein
MHRYHYIKIIHGNQLGGFLKAKRLIITTRTVAAAPLKPNNASYPRPVDTAFSYEFGDVQCVLHSKKGSLAKLPFLSIEWGSAKPIPFWLYVKFVKFSLN